MARPFSTWRRAASSIRANGRADGRIRALRPAPVPASGPATELLYSRLTDDDVEATKARIEERYRAAWVGATDAERKQLALAFGLHYGVPGVSERTGLTPVRPPAHIHSMTGGLVAETGGSYYYADMVLEALGASGQTLVKGDHVLDYSCSSGRVVRALAAALPDVSWHGCDPNVEAIEWLQGNLPQVEAFVAKMSPPLPFDDGALAAAFAISVWSHYSADAALRWLREMHRVIRPGGHFIFTTHGFQACVWFTANPDHGLDAKLGARWIAETGRRLEDQGHVFWQMFGTPGDWTVVSPEWGLSFLTPEWLLEHVTPDWALTMYRIGRAQGNQDLFVLERR
jgi:SAM-dependent methyltransferase